MQHGDAANGRRRAIKDSVVELQQDCRRRRDQPIGQGRSSHADWAEIVRVGIAGMPRGLAVVDPIEGRDDRAALGRMASEHVNVPERQRKVHGEREERKP